MYLRVFDEMSFLAERFLAHLTPERFFARVRAQMHLDVALVQKAAIAYVTVMDRPFPGHVTVGTIHHGAPGRRSAAATTAAATVFGLAASVPRLFRGHVCTRTGRGGVGELGRRPRTVHRGRRRRLHVTAQVGRADHVAGRAVRQVRRGGRRRRRRTLHVIAAGVLERRFVGRPVLQPALEQRHERRGGRARRRGRNVGRDQVTGLLRLRLLVQRFLHGLLLLLLLLLRMIITGSSHAAVRHARKLRTGHQVLYSDVGQYAGLGVLRRTVRVLVRSPIVAHAQPLVRPVHCRVIATGRHRGVRPKRRAAHEHLELVKLIVDERVLLLKLGKARVGGRRDQVLVLVVHVVVVGRGRVIVVFGHPVVGRDRLVMVAGYAVDVYALRDRVERHQRLEVGEIRGRLGVWLLRVDAVRLVMVMVVMTAAVVLLMVTVVVMLLWLVLLWLGRHHYRCTVRSILIATQQVFQLRGVQHEFRTVLVQEVLVEL